MWADVLFDIQLFLVVSIVNYIGEILQDYLGIPNFEADFGKNLPQHTELGRLKYLLVFSLLSKVN